MRYVTINLCSKSATGYVARNNAKYVLFTLTKIRDDISVEFARTKEDWVTLLSSEKKIHKIHNT